MNTNPPDLQKLEQQLYDLETQENEEIYYTNAELAVPELAKCGAEAFPLLLRALQSRAFVWIPIKCFDQWVYIGDYDSKYVAVKELAREALYRIGQQNQTLETHTALIELAEQATDPILRTELINLIARLGYYWHPDLKDRRNLLFPPAPPPTPARKSRAKAPAKPRKAKASPQKKTTPKTKADAPKKTTARKKPSAKKKEE